MKFVLFYQSLISDWNHGTAHFLRGYVRELLRRGHEVDVYEPADSWCVMNLRADHGDAALAEFYAAYPELSSYRYGSDLDLEAALDGADVVIVHEWNDHDLVARVGRHRARAHNYTLLFHDTHHRSVTAPREMAAYDLRDYQGVLAFGSVIRDIYRDSAWAEHAWTWHEAADAQLFAPHRVSVHEGDVVWVGNWGDDERTAELRRMLIDPIAALELRCRVHGVRYPDDARAALAAAGITYGGWLPNFHVPATFARHRVTVHVPRGPCVETLPGIPTIRLFEALACGIPMISSPWYDTEGLFTAGEDYLVARDPAEMTQHLRAVLNDKSLAASLVEHGRASILARHTCAHRVDELFAILAELGQRTIDVFADYSSTPCIMT